MDQGQAPRVVVVHLGQASCTAAGPARAYSECRIDLSSYTLASPKHLYTFPLLPLISTDRENVARSFTSGFALAFCLRPR